MSCRLLLAQINLLVGDVAGNTRRIRAISQRARDHYQADAVVFPELTLTGYPPEDLLLRPEFIQQVEQALETLRQTVTGITLILGYPKRASGALYNCAGVIRDGCLLGEYRKQALPNYGVFDEKRYFQAGNSPFVIKIGDLDVGLMLCEDIWMAEPARQARAAGAQLLLTLNASPFHLNKQQEREAQVRRRVEENGLAVVYVNLVGGQDELVFDGSSFVMDSQGQVAQRGPFCAEAELLVALDALGQPQSAELLKLPSADTAVYQALVLGIRDYVHKNGFQGAVLGLSGGIDSAMTLTLAVAALGAAQVEAVLMPSRYTADMSNNDAISQCKTLGVNWKSLSIEPVFSAFLDVLAPAFAGLPADVTEENLQARCRGVLLMALSNKSGKILLTTGNKSELSVGYATLYGDMAGGFAPLKDVFKTRVYRLAAYCNQQTHIIPARVLERPPSAELRPEQRDEDSLPPYPILDAILQRYIEMDASVAEIVAAGFDLATVERVARLVDRNEYKRRQAPPGVRITSRAFGRDRRYPLTRGL